MIYNLVYNRASRIFAVQIFFIIFLSTHAYAQGTLASIIGNAREDSGIPLSNVTIRIKNESTGFTTFTKTNENGRYDFKQLPLGGPYTISATHVEKGDIIKTGIQLNQGDVARVDFDLSNNVYDIDAVEVKATSLKNTKDYLGAATAISARAIQKLPVNGRNFTSLTDLSPLAKGNSISGQLGSSTNFTLDGMNAKNPTSAGATTSRSGAPYSISMEAVREFKVVTNQYDVTFGRSGGGTISAATKAGTNTLTGSAFVYGRANWLTSPYDIRGNKLLGSYSTYQYGFSLGGPIIKDKLHFFVVWDHQQDNRSLLIADIRSQTDEVLYKTTQSTLDQFLSIARTKYAVGNETQFGNIPKSRNSDAVFLRLDYQLNKNNLLTIRNNATYDNNPLGLQDNSSINLLESYGNDRNFDNSFLATLRTSISPKITNELKVQHLYVYQNSTQGNQISQTYIPRAIVENVESSVGGRNLSTTIQLGGHRFAQENFRNNVFQLVNNFYYDTDRAKYTFGFDFMATRSKSVYGSEVNGRYHFTSSTGVTAMENFENLAPYRYYREVPLKDDISVKETITNIGVYGQMKTFLTPAIEMTAGLRLDYAAYPKAAYNPLVFDELGIKTDNRLQSFIAQPRIQFTWDVNENQTDYIKFGGGIFASDINNYVIINNLTFDGTNFATVDVTGAAIPQPNFAAYRNDLSTIPTLAANQLPTINFTGEDAKVPTLYKANISYTHFFSDKFKTSVTGFMSLARNNYTYVDRNMVKDPYFTLANEGNRGVFVPLASMPANGQPDWKASRISTKLGRVLELTSIGKIDQYALSIDATYNYWKDAEASLSFTWNDTKDNTSFNGNVANSATLSQPVTDDPRDLSRISYSDNHFRHKIVFYGTLPSFYGVNVGFRYTGMGGSRFTFYSGGNTNGDFVTSTNDLAYVFDINDPSTPPNIKSGLQTILDNPEASQSIKDYILAYQGEIAQRNGGINEFYGLVDLRISKKLNLYQSHGVEISAEIFNFMNMLNKEWGVNRSLGNQALYALGIAASETTAALPAFDVDKAQFNYRVNNSGLATPSGNPYQVQLGLRYSF